MGNVSTQNYIDFEHMITPKTTLGSHPVGYTPSGKESSILSKYGTNSNNGGKAQPSINKYGANDGQIFLLPGPSNRVRL